MDRGRVAGGDRDSFSSPFLRASGTGLVIGVLLAGLVASGGRQANAQVRVTTTLSTTLTVSDDEVDDTLTTLVETVSTLVEETGDTLEETATTLAKTVTTVVDTVEETADTVVKTVDDPVVKTVDSVVESAETAPLPTATTLAVLTPTTIAASTDTTGATETTIVAEPIAMQMSPEAMGARLRQTACDTRALGLDPQAAGPCPNDQAPAEVLAGTLPGTDSAPPPMSDLAARIRAVIQFIQELLAGAGSAVTGVGGKLAETLPFSGLAAGVLAGLGAILVSAGRGTLRLDDWLRRRHERDG